MSATAGPVPQPAAEPVPQPAAQPGPEPAAVTGVRAPGVVHVDYAEVDRLRTALEEGAATALRAAAHCATTAASPALLASAVLAPTSVREVEATLAGVGAVLAATAAGATAQAALMRRVVEDLRAVDDGARAALTAATTGLALALGREDVPPVVTATPLRVPGATTPPRDLTGLARRLQAVNALSDGDHPERNGTMEVQTVVGADGRRRHVVYLPGTDDLDPFSADSDVRDMDANLHLEAGLPTAHGAGILHALQQAGVRSGEPVLLVGHSQGGMEAMALASAGTAYDITDVVTFGSPQVPGHLPAGVHVLSLEHQGDLVPLSDFGAPPTGAHHVTVGFDSGIAPTAALNHDMAQYVAGAHAAQQDVDPVVQQAVHHLDGFLHRRGDHTSATVLQIVRGDGAR